MAVLTDGAVARPPRTLPDWLKPQALILQLALLIAVILLGAWMVDNVQTNLRTRGIATGFAFLDNPSQFEIAEGLIPHSRTSSYANAFQVGLWNTIRVSLIGIVFATLIGVFVGLARLSANWLLRRLADGYVESIRNIPLILQLFIWYGLITNGLPQLRDALNLGAGFWLSNRGLRMPWPEEHPTYDAMAAALIMGLGAALIIRAWGRARQDATGERLPLAWITIGLLVVPPIAVWLIAGMPVAFEMPEKQRFNFTGGTVLSAEFVTLLIGLSTYTAAFIAEVVRAGILAVSKGQSEAAAALGLPRSLALQKVILPQALRVIIPPLTNQYLNLTKNSSLAIAVGYPDLVSVGNTTMNQTGQAIEAVMIFMGVYLFLSLLISILMNWYNARIALKER